MDIQWVDINEVKPDPRNPNKHPKEQIDRLVKLIKHHGWRWPIIVSKQDGMIKAGHGRLMAAQQMSLKEVPVSYQDFASPEDAYAFLVSDNGIGSWSDLDFAAINTDVGMLGPDFDIELLGLKDFTVEVADKLEPQCDEDEVPEKVEPRTKLGDVYLLGKHRLMCGDSTSIDAVEKLMGGEKADMVFTDPPYGIGFEYNSHDDSNSEQCKQLVWDVFSLHDCGKVWTPGLKNLPRDISRFGTTKVLCWYKSFSMMGNGIGGCSTWEPVLVLNPTNKKMNNDHIELKIEKQWFEGKQLIEYHPCPKPVQLYELLINNLSNEKENLFEPFGGSGTTLITCEKTNRKCFSMEIDPKYCDLIVARWEKYTGKKAELISGETP